MNDEYESTSIEKSTNVMKFVSDLLGCWKIIHVNVTNDLAFL